MEKVDCATYIIAEPQGSQYNVNFLIAGNERAVLFDTGLGEASLYHLVDSLTNVPVTVVFSHFHFDHVGNTQEFDQHAFIDLEYLHERADAGGNFEFTFQEVLASSPSEVVVNEWWGDGQAIDLGERTISLWNIPGHTPESVAIVDSDRKYFFAGDFMYNGTLYAFLPGNDLPAYEASTERIIQELGSEYTYFGAHSSPRVEFNKFETLIDLFACIEDGSCTPTAFNAFGYPVSSYSLNGLTIWTEPQ
ncbi:MAG: MBL fold metallo-hydrolase [Flavobacteriales bacterium]|nr:MBL fold metallo-hydrolase [Flavobacteriales bacterium]